jgi:hypothetical protein
MAGTDSSFWAQRRRRAVDETFASVSEGPRQAMFAVEVGDGRILSAAGRRGYVFVGACLLMIFAGIVADEVPSSRRLRHLDGAHDPTLAGRRSCRGGRRGTTREAAGRARCWLGAGPVAAEGRSDAVRRRVRCAVDRSTCDGLSTVDSPSFAVPSNVCSFVLLMPVVTVGRPPFPLPEVATT